VGRKLTSQNLDEHLAALERDRDRWLRVSGPMQTASGHRAGLTSRPGF